MIRKLVFSFFINCLIFTCAYGQHNLIDHKYMQARQAIYKKEYNIAIKYLNEILQINNKSANAYYLLGEIYDEKKDLAALEDLYFTAVKSCYPDNPEFILLYANTLFELGKMHEAVEQYNLFLKQRNIKSSYHDLAQKMKSRSETSISIMSKPVPFNPINMGEAINSEYHEYLPSLSVDEQTMVITRKIPKDLRFTKKKSDFHEDFFISYKNDRGDWTKAINMGSAVNTIGNEGGQCISADGNTLVLTACNRADSYGTCDLYISYRNNDNTWTKAVNLGPLINTSHWESQPSLSTDGSILYFASNRPGGYGNSDIWYSEKDESGKWGLPKNMGAVINTEEAEISPFIHSDGNTFYFASKGHPGVGGYDIFYSRKGSDNKWQKPVNLGYPINTVKDEISLIVNAQGQIAYFASEREDGYGKQDIYQFELHIAARPNSVTYFRGNVFDKYTKQPLKGSVQLIDLKNGNTVFLGPSQNNGNFLVCLSAGNEYALNVFHDNYIFYSENIVMPFQHDNKPYKKDIPLSPIATGESFVLRNIFFDSDSYELKAESKYELNKLIDILQRFPAMKIQIIGHTDIQGSFDYNMALSTNRAKSVMEFLIEQRINANRMLYDGKGLANPIADNTTAEGRALNRRTEILIIEM